MAAPEVIGDRERYAEVGREYRELAPAHELARRYVQLRDDLEGARELLAEDGDDPELRALVAQAPAEVGGFKEVTFAIKGEGAYSVFKYEGGTHRVQRVPKTESQGRIHTSTATVAVLPEAEELELERQRAEIAADRRAQVGTGERSEKIRTYNFPQGRVTDHRIKHTSHDLEGVLAGGLDGFTDALAAEEKRARLAAQATTA